MLPSSRLLACFFATLATAANISLSIAPSQHLLNPSSLPYNTQAQLAARGILLSTLLRADNTFYFENVPTGSFSLDVFCRDYFFEPLRVDVTTHTVEAWQTFRGNEWDNKGESRVADGDAAVAKVQVHVLGPKQYYQKREGCKYIDLPSRHLLRGSRSEQPSDTHRLVNVLSFLKSPMILMAVFSMAMIFGMPYLLENSELRSKDKFLTPSPLVPSSASCGTC